MPSASVADFVRVYNSAQTVTALAGAGLSAGSGIATFRGAGGLWKTHNANQLATPEAFEWDPQLVSNFYHWRRKIALAAEPNAGHLALAKLAPTLITQNVDGLSRGLGHTTLLEMHGCLREYFCNNCEDELDEELTAQLPDEGVWECQQPECDGLLRPDVVWFGETPEHMDEIDRIMAATDLLLVVGTSGTVWPASILASRAKEMGGAKVAVFNVDGPSIELEEDADYWFKGKCEETLPNMVKAIEAGL